MKLTILALLSMGLASAAWADDKQSDKKPAPAKAQQIAIPADAVEVEPYTYRYTDPAGKNWLYRKTPFGVSRTEVKPASPEAVKKVQEEKDRLIDATFAREDGDSIHFDRDSPFGHMDWRRKKTELNEIEQAAWNRELRKRAAQESASSNTVAKD
jgi:hypothetical protein